MPLSLTADLANADVQALPASFVAVTTPVATPAGDQSIWDIRAVEMDGTTNVAFYPSAPPPDITWNYNTPDTAEVAIRIDDHGLAFLDPDAITNHEITIWRNGHRLYTGKPTKRRADSESRMMIHSCADPTWYLTKRFIGHAKRLNLLKNDGSGRDGVTTHPWVEVDPHGVLAFTIDTNWHLSGTHSFKLACSSTQAPYVRQRYVLRASPQRRNLFLVAHVLTGDWSAPAIFNAGLILVRLGATGPGAYSHAPITVDTERGRWVRLVAKVTIPPNRAETVEARLFAPHATSRWSDIRLNADFHLGWGAGVDQGAVVSDTVAYAQGKGKFAALARDKTDLNIRTAMPVSTGVEVQSGLRVNLSEHRKLYDGVARGSGFLDHYLNAFNGIDWRFDPQGRILRGYYPAIGIDRTNVTFTYRRFPANPERNAQWGIKSWDWAESIEAAANQVTLLGGSGGKPGDPTREEGGYNNLQTLGGVGLETVETAPQGTPISQLDARAQARGARLRHPVATPQLTLVEPRDPVTDEVIYPLIGVLLPGDTIAVDVVDGQFIMQGEFRIVQVELSGATEELTVTFNPVLA